MEKRTILDRIEVDSDGTVFVRLLKQVVDNNEALFSEPHRISIQPTTSVDEHMSIVNTNLSQMGWPTVDVKDLQRLKSHADVARTPEVISAWKAKKAKTNA